MKLQSLRIENFRSIRDQTLKINDVNKSATYSLIGVNESGKSSFLKAISLLDDGEPIPQDFRGAPICLTLHYQLEPMHKKKLGELLEKKGWTKDAIDLIDVDEVDVCITYESPDAPKVYDILHFKKPVSTKYTLDPSSNLPVKKTDPLSPDLDLPKYFETNFPKPFFANSHKTTLWKPDSKHLIDGEIDLQMFSASPENVSIPLKNCFDLAEIEDISKEVGKIKTNSAEINNLCDRLSDAVTVHIKKVWPSHPIKIKFLINNLKLSFLIDDERVRYKSKTTQQRSDGFRTFISFLLTIAAEHASGELSNALLLLDEPETHLHPQAQEYLKKELIKITSNTDNNIVFYATHSIYMIDKENLGRCIRVEKDEEDTELTFVDPKSSSFSEVNYEIFNINSNDYHNELYGYLEETDNAFLSGLPTTKNWHNTKENRTDRVSLPRYIRHSIHHPENTTNPAFTAKELAKSIKILRGQKYPS